jgi:hypothetical protein
MLQWLPKAGAFTVEHVGGIPHEVRSVDLTAPRTGILHTTEGDTIEGALAIFKQHYSPHFLVGPDVSGKVRILQLVQIPTMGLALVTHNWLVLVQVEVVGHSLERPWMFPDATAAAVSALMAACHAEYGIPLSRPWPDGVYGMARASDPHRAEHKFGRIAGWYGHGDTPSPDSHWDPGDLEWSRLFSAAMANEAAHAAPAPPPAASPRPCCASH